MRKLFVWDHAKDSKGIPIPVPEEYAYDDRAAICWMEANFAHATLWYSDVDVLYCTVGFYKKFVE